MKKALIIFLVFLVGCSFAPQRNECGMSVEFDGTSNKKVTFGNTAAIDNLSQITVMAWIFADDEGENSRVRSVDKRS